MGPGRLFSERPALRISAAPRPFTPRPRPFTELTAGPPRPACHAVRVTALKLALLLPLCLALAPLALLAMALLPLVDLRALTETAR